MALTDKLTAIGDAIRAKTGKEDLLTLDAMVEEIANIDTLGLFVDGTSINIYSTTASGIQSYAFYQPPITSIDIPTATYVGAYACYGCKALESINLPMVTSIGEYAFRYCSALVSANLMSLTNVGKYAFRDCSALETVDISSAITIENHAFQDCTALISLILRSETMCTLSAKAGISPTPIEEGTGYIYVPAALLETYKSATNWSAYAEQFRALEDYTVDGTITGELDDTKI